MMNELHIFNLLDKLFDPSQDGYRANNKKLRQKHKTFKEISVFLFSSRHPDKLASVVAQAGSRTHAGTVAQAASFDDVILLAVSYGTLDQTLREINGKLNGKIVIDATNPLKSSQERGLERLIPQDVTGKRVMARHLPTARILKAFTTVHTPKLKSRHIDRENHLQLQWQVMTRRQRKLSRG